MTRSFLLVQPVFLFDPYVTNKSKIELAEDFVMPLAVTDVDELREYIIGVMDRAGHHAGNVDQIALALVGAILWRKDDAAIKVMAQNGETKNVMWVWIAGRRYAFSYNHHSGEIEMRIGSTQGSPIHSFSNRTPLSTLKSIFEAL